MNRLPIGDRALRRALDLAPYRPVSTQPAARRDVSIATAPGTTAEELGDRVRVALGDDAAAVEELAVLAEAPAAELPPAAVARLGLAPEQANLLVRLVLRHPTRTLGAAEANVLRDRVYASLHEARSRRGLDRGGPSPVDAPAPRPDPGRMRPQPLIAVTDVEASSRFYQRLLSVESAHGGPDYERLVRDGALVMQLHRFDVPEHHHDPIGDPGDRPYGNGVLLWFETDEFDAVVARAGELGAEVVMAPHRNPPDGGGGPNHREIWLRDPDGYGIVVASPDGEAGPPPD
jgi:catechol 2,3-dioxygenase-like lactoylglutathione lyase family enzyme